MATYLPQTLDELRLISGFGDVKLARYGKEFLLPVKNYCIKYSLSSKIKHKVPKRERKPKAALNGYDQMPSGTASESFNIYKSGKTIPEIAAERGLAVTTIEGHLSQFIYTSVLAVNEFVSEEKQRVIKDAIESYGAEKLTPLKEVLGEDYSYGEIRAVVAWMRRMEMV